MRRVLLLLALAGCYSPSERGALAELNSIPPITTPVPTDFDVLGEFEAAEGAVYRLGAGDILQLDVWGQEALSGPHTVGPDGYITIPTYGPIKCIGLTREETAALISEALEPFYTSIAVTVRVDQYLGNQVSVLGNVNAPGAYTFEGQPTLLTALAKAGGVRIDDIGVTSTRASISRGGNTIVWIDLIELLSEGNPALNVRLQANDIVYVSDSADHVVYILGEVRAPGAYHMVPNMRIIDVITRARGVTNDAQPRKIELLRPQLGDQARLNMLELVEGGYDLNSPVLPGDIIYVPMSGLAKFGYVMRNISPFSAVMTVSQ